MLPILARLQVAAGCGAVMPFAKKKQKSRQPLAASSSQPTSSSFGTPSLAPAATLADGSKANQNKTSARNCTRFVLVTGKLTLKSILFH
jgi:hypothetical protein